MRMSKPLPMPVGTHRPRRVRVWGEGRMRLGRETDASGTRDGCVWDERRLYTGRRLPTKTGDQSRGMELGFKLVFLFFATIAHAKFIFLLPFRLCISFWHFLLEPFFLKGNDKKNKNRYSGIKETCYRIRFYDYLCRTIICCGG